MRTAAVLGAAGAFLTVGAAANAVHYSERALPGTVVAGESVAGLTRAEVAAVVERRAQEVRLNLVVEGHSTEVSLDQIGVHVDADATADAAVSATPWSSLGLFGLTPLVPSMTEVPVVFTVDHNGFRSFVSAQNPHFPLGAKDAEVTFDPSDATFAAIGAESGPTIALEDLHTVVDNAVSGRATTLPTRMEAPGVPTVIAQSGAALANALLAQDVSVNFGDEVYTASATEKATWLQVDCSAPLTCVPVVDRSEVQAWVDGVAAQVSSTGEGAEEHVNSAGEIIGRSEPNGKVRVVTNSQGVGEDLYEAFVSHEAYSGTFEVSESDPSYLQVPVPDWSNTELYTPTASGKWIDVDLSANTATAYEGYLPVRGPVPMVPGAPETPTLTGTFSIYHKQAVQTLRGTNADGTPYVVPDVPWILYYDGNFALHAAPWRTTFGWSGEGGSHGCVNMPVAQAQWFYEWSQIGTTVLLHY